MSALGHGWQKWQLPTTNQSSKLVRHIVMSSKPMLHIECRNRSPKIDIKTSPRAVKSPGPWLISLCEETPKLRAMGHPQAKAGPLRIYSDHQPTWNCTSSLHTKMSKQSKMYLSFDLNSVPLNFSALGLHWHRWVSKWSVCSQFYLC